MRVTSNNLPLLQQNSGLAKKLSQGGPFGEHTVLTKTVKADALVLSEACQRSTERFSERFAKNNKELLRALKNMPEDEKQYAAMRAVREMQSLCTQAINRERGKLDSFKKYSGEKEYYTSLLNTSGNEIEISDGKYLFSAVETGTALDRKHVEDALNSIQQKINLLVSPEPPEKSSIRNSLGNDFEKRLFTAYASIFSAATGYSVSLGCLNADDDTSLLWNVWDRTEENFVEKATQSIEALKNRSEGIRNLLNKYLQEEGGIEEQIIPPDKEVGFSFLEYMKLKLNLDFLEKEEE